MSASPWHTEDGRRRRGTVTPTRYRRFYDPRGHAAPMAGVDRHGERWQGTSRPHTRAERRRHNRSTWRRIVAEARREALAGELAAALEQAAGAR